MKTISEFIMEQESMNIDDSRPVNNSMTLEKAFAESAAAVSLVNCYVEQAVLMEFMSENGYDSMTIIQEAGEETKPSIFKRAGNAIKNAWAAVIKFIKSILAKIKGLFSKKKNDTDQAKKEMKSILEQFKKDYPEKGDEEISLEDLTSWLKVKAPNATIKNLSKDNFYAVAFTSETNRVVEEFIDMLNDLNEAMRERINAAKNGERRPFTSEAVNIVKTFKIYAFDVQTLSKGYDHIKGKMHTKPSEDLQKELMDEIAGIENQNMNLLKLFEKSTSIETLNKRISECNAAVTKFDDSIKAFDEALKNAKIKEDNTAKKSGTMTDVNMSDFKTDDNGNILMNDPDNKLANQSSTVDDAEIISSIHTAASQIITAIQNTVASSDLIMSEIHNIAHEFLKNEPDKKTMSITNESYYL